MSIFVVKNHHNSQITTLMMEKDDISVYSNSDGYFISRIGEFVRYNRVAQNKTQEELSEAAGINRSTLVQLEKGKSVNLLSFIQVLRALKRLDILNEIEVKPQISPLKYAAIQIKTKRRASGKTHRATSNKSMSLVDVSKESKKPKSDW